MSLVEGVGDEVTILFALVFCLLVLALAWVSTHTSEWGNLPFTFAASASATSQRGTSSPSSDGLGQNGPQHAGEELVQEGRAQPDALDDNISVGLRHRVAPASPQGAAHPAEGPSPSESLHPIPAGSAETIVLRLKFLNDTERLIRVRPEDPIGHLKRTFFPGQEHQVRLIYQGQLLQNDAQTVSSLHLTNNSVLHCHISQHATPQTPAGTRGANQAPASLNMGNLMMPLFLSMLALLWYLQVQYYQYFTASATVCLASITIVFSFMAFGIYRR